MSPGNRLHRAPIARIADVDLRQLEYFAAVARRRHFTRAAEALYVSQSALSQQIARLERELGVPLLVRGPRGVDLTPAGAALLERAEEILELTAAANAAVAEHADVARGVARLALTSVETPRLLEPLAQFHKAHPGIQVSLRQGSTTEALDLLSHGAVDLAIVGAVVGAPVPTGARIAASAPEPLRLIAGPSFEPVPPAGFEALRDRALVLTDRRSALRELVMASCGAAGFSPLPVFEAGDPQTVRFLVGLDLAISVVPASWLAHDGPEVNASAISGAAGDYAVVLLEPAAGTLAPAAALLREHLAAALV
jgi:DNA-binding transcriptional LysR family regulator